MFFLVVLSKLIARNGMELIRLVLVVLLSGCSSPWTTAELQLAGERTRLPWLTSGCG